jgi:class 3 adenylate cyclase
MAASGIRACEIGLPATILQIEKTRRAIYLALDMLEYAENQSWGQEGNPLIIKIGIHIGRVIAGVIGHHKPQFSLIGDTVNTTSRLCSTGKEGFLTISQEAYDKVKGASLYFKRQSVFVRD